MLTRLAAAALCAAIVSAHPHREPPPPGSVSLKQGAPALRRAPITALPPLNPEHSVLYIEGLFDNSYSKSQMLQYAQMVRSVGCRRSPLFGRGKALPMSSRLCREPMLFGEHLVTPRRCVAVIRLHLLRLQPYPLALPSISLLGSYRPLAPTGRLQRLRHGHPGVHARVEVPAAARVQQHPLAECASLGVRSADASKSSG
jgi:hypothetical protein